MKDLLRYQVTQLDEVDPIECPCGLARRAFGDLEGVASLHLVDISKDSKTHYHKRMHEIYLVLEGEGFIELDGERVPAKPMTAVFIKPVVFNFNASNPTAVLLSAVVFSNKDL